MKSLFITFLFIYNLTYCFSQKRKQSSEYTIDLGKQSKKVIDSLTLSSVDTILDFYKGCAGCIEGVKKSVYIFWKKNNDFNLIEIQNYGNKERIFKHVDADIFSFFYLNQDSIMQQHIVEPKYWQSDGPYSEIDLFLRNKVIFNIYLPDYYETDSNNNKKIFIWIYFIESKLFNLDY